MKLILLSLTLGFLVFSSVAQERINQTDNNGLKQGVWVKKYENDQERYRGQFLDNYPIGTFFHYNEKGAKTHEMKYLGKEGVEAEAVFFHLNGAIMAQGKYVNKEKEGAWKYFDNKTVISSEEHYKGGKLNGLSKVYFLNGQLAAEIPYVDDLKNGAFTEYFPDGTINIKGTYQDNTYTGAYEQNFPSGSLRIRGQYKAAVKDGKWLYYAEDGLIKAQQYYENGKLVKEKVEEGFDIDVVPVDIKEKDKIQERELQDALYNLPDQKQ